VADACFGIGPTEWRLDARRRKRNAFEARGIFRLGQLGKPEHHLRLLRQRAAIGKLVGPSPAPEAALAHCASLYSRGVSYQNIKLNLAGAVGELVLARPDARNAMIAEMGAEISRAVGEINAAPGLRAL